MKRTYLLLALLALAAFLPAQLTITSPNGGETWQTGSTYDITWTQENLDGNASIMLISGNPANPMTVIANSVPVIDETYSWEIPQTVIPGDFYRVRIRMQGNTGMMIHDFSDAPFTIGDGTNPPPNTYLTVLSPNGGEAWEVETTQTITWDYENLDGAIRIELVNPQNNDPTLIADNVPIAGESYEWTIPADTVIGPHKVRIVWITDMAVYFGDLSDDCFFITGDTPPPPPPGILTLTSPNGGEEWEAGSTQSITWTSENLDGNLNIALMGGRHPGPGIYYISQDIPVTDGTFDWTIPVDMHSGTHYRVRIFLPADPGITAVDVSDAPFTIIGDPGPGSAEINVTSPNGGESWSLSSTQEITWTDEEYAGNVNIFLVRGVNPYHNSQIIEHLAPNTGSYIWSIPNDVDPGDDYKIHIVRPGGGMDFSDAPFSIVDPLANLKASPNPSKDGTSISFDLKAPATTSVRIYNIKGQIIRTLMENNTLQGKQNVTWDGKDQSGRKVTAGIYFAKISADKYYTIQKLIIMK